VIARGVGPAADAASDVSGDIHGQRLSRPDADATTDVAGAIAHTALLTRRPQLRMMRGT